MMFGQGQGNIDLDYSYNLFTHLFYYINKLPATISKQSIIITFSHKKAKVATFDIVVKKLQVNLGLSFEQTIMGLCPRCYIPSLVEIS